MSVSAAAMTLILAYVAASVFYVYRLRGRARYRSFSQYLRKSWPVFAPFNCLLYVATDRAARKPVIDAGYLPDIRIVRENWGLIRREALALYAAGGIDGASVPGSPGYYDLGFRTFYKRGWKKFYLKWYGAPHASARRLCPETVRILQRVPGIHAAMFSVLPAGAELTLHADPLACSLRYHLGLCTPNSQQCFISVDGVEIPWRDGEDFVFDETYPHYAKNGTDGLRLILMCDVRRPMNPLGRAFNRVYAAIPKAMTVPNTAEDPRGAVSGLFAAVAPWRERAIAFKRRHRRTYLVAKLALNSALVTLSFVPIYAMIKWLERGLNGMP